MLKFVISETCEAEKAANPIAVLRVSHLFDSWSFSWRSLRKFKTVSISQTKGYLCCGGILLKIFVIIEQTLRRFLTLVQLNVS